MAHARQQIRDAVVAALTTAAIAGGRIYSGHVYRLSTLPAVNVTTPAEERDEDKSANDADAFAVVIAVNIHAAAASDLDDTLDALAAAIHQTMAGDSTLAGLVTVLSLLETETELEDEAKTPHGRLTMRWGALYLVSPTDPESLV